MFPKYHKTIISLFLRILSAVSITSLLIFSPQGTISSQVSEFTLIVDTHGDSNDLQYQACSESPGDCTLRGAISVANADPANRYIITLPGGTYPVSLPGTSENNNFSGDLDIKGNVTLTGIEDGVSIVANQLDRVFHILPGALVTIEKIHISGGKSSDGVNEGDGESGGGIYNQGSLTLKNCTLEGNQAGMGAFATEELFAGAGGSGGGIQNNGYLVIEYSVLRNNAAGIGGDGHYCGGMVCCCDDCNPAGDGGVGGGINNDGNLMISNSSLENNSAAQAGVPGLCTVSYCTWETPGQSGYGGGIANQSHLIMNNTILQGNQGLLHGGGLSNMGYAVMISNTLSDNNADQGGGLSNSSYLEIEVSLVISNTGDQGGGIYNQDKLHILNSTLSNNNAILGGGIYNQGDAFLSTVFITNNWTRNGPDGAIGYPDSHCAGQDATDGESPHGGGIYNTGNIQLDQGDVSGNATGDGGKGGDGYTWSGEGTNGGTGGFGGGIYNTGRFNMNFTQVDSNTTGDGGMGGVGDMGVGPDGTGGFGGGIYNSGLMNITLGRVTDNQIGTGSGGAGSGGGIANEGTMQYSMGIISNNQTSPGGDGGGIYMSSPLTLTASTVVSNTAGGRGGGIFAGGGTLDGINDIIAHNSIGSGYQGSGFYLQGTDASLTHTSLAQNTGGDGSGISVVDASLEMTNTILVSHTIGISVAQGSEAILERTLWGDGSWANETDWAGNGTIITATQNYWLEPAFVDPLNLNYHLGPTSAAIDRAAPTEIDTDIDNQPRPNPSTLIDDLGADEYWELVPISEVDISGPLTGTTYNPISFSAIFDPHTATPNILYYWLPVPDSGQWTNSVSYQWARTGAKTLKVTAFNVDSLVTDTFTIWIEPAFMPLFLPIVNR